MNAKRLIPATIAALAIGTIGAVQPAQANPAGGGNYAASIATATTPIVGKVGVYSFGATIRSTSSSVTTLHGTLHVVVQRRGRVYVDKSIPVSVASGETVVVTTIKKSSFPGKKKYAVGAFFTATSGHIEKSSESATVVRL